MKAKAKRLPVTAMGTQLAGQPLGRAGVTKYRPGRDEKRCANKTCSQMSQHQKVRTTKCPSTGGVITAVITLP